MGSRLGVGTLQPKESRMDRDQRKVTVAVQLGLVVISFFMIAVVVVVRLLG